MPVQTTFTQDQPAKLEGARADASPARIDNYYAEEAIPFGRGVEQGSTDSEVTVAGTGGTVVGVALRAQLANDGATNQYPIGETVAVMRWGTVWLEAASAVAKEADAYIVASGGDQGKITDVSTDNLGPVGKFLESGADGDLVKVELSLGLRGAQGEPGV